MRIVRLHVGDQPLPEPERLGVRVIDPEDANTVAHPEEHDVAQFEPERRPRVVVEMKRVDVLITLGRILRVLQRAIRPLPEPLGVLRGVGMIW